MCERDGRASWVEPLSRRGGRLGWVRHNDRLRTADLGGRFMEPWAHDPVLRLAAWLRSVPMGHDDRRRPTVAGQRRCPTGLPRPRVSSGRTVPRASENSQAGLTVTTLVQLASARTAANWSTIQSRSAALIA